MSESKPAVTQEERDRIADLIADLGGKEGMARQQARNALVKIGPVAVPDLVDALANDKDMHRRWEAAKALSVIRSPEAAEVLVDTLMDESSEIRWLAAEGLIALKRDALGPLMNALYEKPKDVWLRHGVHHVLHALERSHLLDEASLQVLDALRSLEPEVTIPLVAHRALEALKKDGP